MVVSDIIKLKRSENKIIANKATRIFEIIEREKSHLLEDEIHHIIEPLGINMTENYTYITYYVGSKRLSVECIAKTSSKKDTIRWALLAPPNHSEKRGKVVKYLRRNKDTVKKVRKEIERDGLSPHPSWEEYGLW